MGSSRRILDFLYRLFVNIFINYYLIALLLDFFKVEKTFNDTLVILGTSLVAVSIWRVLFKKTFMFILVGGVSVGTVLYFSFYLGQIFIQAQDKAGNITRWSHSFLGWLKLVHPNYFNIFLILTVLVFSLVTSILIYNMRKSFYVFAALTILFIVRWFQYSDIALEYFMYYVTFVLMLYAHNKYIQKEDEWIKDKKEIKPKIFKRWIVFSTVLCMILVLISAAMPKNFKPVTWRWLDDQFQQRFPSLHAWRNNKKSSYSYGNIMRFDLSLTDYQGEAKRLGGPVEQKGVLVMTVTSQEPIYLKGRVKDFYTGSNWEATKVKVNAEAKDTDNSLVKDKKIEGETITITINHKNLITSSIFNTFIPKSIELGDNHYYITESFETFSSKLMLRDRPYTVTSIKPFVEWDRVKTSSYSPREELEKYLQIPDEFPKRVNELSEKISTNKKSDYERVKALEKYLSSSFPYTLDPPETPLNRDFVDYFLFDVKKGYCTYFATSLTMMARSIGIPARYVDGYVISKDSFKESGSYYVYSDDAHAWSEVYIEGYGWMIFEGTPGFESTQKEKTEASTDSAIEANNSVNNMKEVKEVLNEDELTDGLATEEMNIIEVLKYVLIILLLTLLVIFTIIIFNYYKIKRLFKKIGEKSNKERVLDYYRVIMKLLDYIHKEKRVGETVLEYSKRLNLENWEVNTSFREVSDIFIKARYSQEDIDNEESNVVWEYFVQMDSDVKNKVGRLRYFAFKYLRMGIE